jgi:phage/plasmid primase-like uncharacterized protein
MTIPELDAQGVFARHFRPGNQRLACPRCNKSGRDTALSLTIEHDGHAVWHCFRCAWSGGTSRDTWRKDYAIERTKLDTARHAEAIKRADAKLNATLAGYAQAAERARATWAAAGPAPSHHPYLLRKRLSGDGLRIAENFQSLRHALLVPMRDASGAIVNLQGIDADGQKRFVTGAAVKRSFALAGRWVKGEAHEHVAVGEGYATCAAFLKIYPGYVAVAAMSCSNLLAVAGIVREKFPHANIVVLRDRDKAGSLAAWRASCAIGAECWAAGAESRPYNDFADAWVAQ